MWSERYRPASVSDMVGNEEARSQVMEWFAGWRRGTQPLLLSGPPGTGKTTMARLASDAFGYDMVEMNASDARSKSRINRILSPTLDNAGLAGRPAIFVDEADGIHGSADYGGGEALLRLLKKPAVPVVLASNAEDTGKMKAMAKASKHVRFRRVPPRLLQLRLNHVLKAEGAVLGPGARIRATTRSQGDIRALLNLAQSLATGFRPEAGPAAEERDAQRGVNDFFAAKSPAQAASVLQSMQMDPREKIRAFHSSVVGSGLDPPKMARMLGVLSRADALYGRIIATANWRLLRYLNAILAEMYEGDSGVTYVQYSLPFPVLNRIRFDSKKLRALNLWLGGQLHMSGAAAASTVTPYYVELARRGAAEPPEELADTVSKEAAP